jgi:hypothetical protein
MTDRNFSKFSCFYVYRAKGYRHPRSETQNKPKRPVPAENTYARQERKKMKKRLL